MMYDLLILTLFTRYLDAHCQTLYPIFTLCAINFEISTIVPFHCIAIECNATIFLVQQKNATSSLILFEVKIIYSPNALNNLPLWSNRHLN